MKKFLSGFTLIEVLLALSIIAIALTALLRTTAQDVASSSRLKELMVQIWVARQAIDLAQLEIFKSSGGQVSTQITEMMGIKVYWRMDIRKTPVKSMTILDVSTATKSSGPYRHTLTGFNYTP